MNMRYKVVLEKEAEGGYSVYVPALPGCYSQGGTEAEALANAREAIECHLESLRKDGVPVPAEPEEIIREIEIAV